MGRHEKLSTPGPYKSPEGRYRLNEILDKKPIPKEELGSLTDLRLRTTIGALLTVPDIKAQIPEGAQDLPERLLEVKRGDFVYHITRTSRDAHESPGIKQNPKARKLLVWELGITKNRVIPDAVEDNLVTVGVANIATHYLAENASPITGIIAVKEGTEHGPRMYKDSEEALEAIDRITADLFAPQKAA